MNVTRDDVQRVAKTYFTPNNRVVLHILPKGEVAMKRLSALGIGLWLPFRIDCGCAGSRVAY